MSLYTIVLRKFTRVLIKRQPGSRQRRLGKTAVIKAGACIVSMDRKTTVYGLKVVKSRVLGNAYKLSIAMRARVSLVCL